MIVAAAVACSLGLHSGNAVRAAEPQPKAAASPGIFPAWMTAPFRDTEYGHRPHYGTPDAPSRGHTHYDLPSQRYGQWYRPRAFGLGVEERCAPKPFQPRGYGHLDARPSTCYRVDYHPYVLDDPTTRFGPSYYWRQPDEHCPCHGP